MIRILEKQIADKIAAGEVIERPVSVVKELTENAIDAGASAVTVEIEHGGKSRIRVTDDGCGIPRAEAETAFLRHATSKIATAQDLDAIRTLGFRGEALASIAAVTRTELITKTADEKVGTRLTIHGGTVLERQSVGCPDGTTLIVTDLFYNTPARRKFLKSDGAESAQILDLLSRIALAYPRIRFRFIKNGEVLFTTSGDGDLRQAILDVYRIPAHTDLVPVSGTAPGCSVSGYISRPDLTRANRRDQIFYVNGRVISSAVLQRGVQEGYQERLFAGRYPVVFLMVQVDPAQVDVNIHPNKREVRFDDEAQIIQLIAASIRQALGSKEAMPEITYSVQSAAFAAEARREAAQTEQPEIDIKQFLSTKRRPTVMAPMASAMPSAAETAQVSRDGDPAAAGTAASTSMAREPGFSYGAGEMPAGQRPALSVEAPAPQPFSFRDLQLTGVLFSTYLTAVDGDSFYLIDQHAAHERVLYEQLVDAYQADEKLRQPILTPILLETGLALRETEYDWLDALRELGFSVAPFGPDTYRVDEIPTCMGLSEAEDFLKTYLDCAAEERQAVNTVVIDKLITHACKAAVKAHDVLSPAEGQALLAQLAACRNPFSCPHGRPTFLRLSRQEIEHLFRRT